MKEKTQKSQHTQGKRNEQYKFSATLFVSAITGIFIVLVALIIARHIK